MFRRSARIALRGVLFDNAQEARAVHKDTSIGHVEECLQSTLSIRCSASILLLLPLFGNPGTGKGQMRTFAEGLHELASSSAKLAASENWVAYAPRG